MDQSGARTVATTIEELFRFVHDQFRERVEGLDPDALNWAPAEGANSIAVLIRHTLGSESEMLQALRQITTHRDRDSEFVGGDTSSAMLIAMIERANKELAEHVSALTADDLTALRPRGERPPKPGLEWLLGNYGHAREHLAQVELTQQLYEATHK
jgi:DinB superfamily